MKIHFDKIEEPQSSHTPEILKEPGRRGTATIADNRRSTIRQRKLRETMSQTAASKPFPIQRRTPKGSSRFQQIATDMGKKYGVDTSGLEATHHSSFPAKLNAEATIQGSKIHFAPGMDTDYNIRHEVAHAIDNTLNGIPKGNQVMNGQRIDTTRERVVDRMAKQPMGAGSLAPVQRKSRNTTANEPLQLRPRNWGSRLAWIPGLLAGLFSRPNRNANRANDQQPDNQSGSRLSSYSENSQFFGELRSFGRDKDEIRNVIQRQMELVQNLLQNGRFYSKTTDDEFRDNYFRILDVVNNCLRISKTLSTLSIKTELDVFREAFQLELSLGLIKMDLDGQDFSDFEYDLKNYLHNLRQLDGLFTRLDRIVDVYMEHSL